MVASTTQPTAALSPRHLHHHELIADAAIAWAAHPDSDTHARRARHVLLDHLQNEHSHGRGGLGRESYEDGAQRHAHLHAAMDFAAAQPST